MSDDNNKSHVIIKAEQCKGCGICIETCPVDVLDQSDDLNANGYHPAFYKGEGCIGCGFCHYSCPEPGTITVIKDMKELTQTKFCENCDEERKVFQRDESSKIYYCAYCLDKIED